jgi:uncharacterized protein YndB with AHSA1/START domain
MSNQAATSETIEAVRYAVTVPLPPDQAFGLFTDGFSSWWPGHHIGTADMAEAVLEARTGGRYYERGVDGTECEWGRVLAWEPPHRLLLTWQIGPGWSYEPDPGQGSQIEVTFTAESAGQTRVDFAHRHLERYGADAERMQAVLDGPGGAVGVVTAYAAAMRPAKVS